MLRICEAPPQLVAHCIPAESAATVQRSTEYDVADIANLLRFLTERDAFDAYEDWCSAGMALKVAFGDAGRDLWALTHNETVTPDVIESKWRSFTSEARPGGVTIASLLKRAHQRGWQAAIRKSSESMFGDVVKRLEASPSIAPANDEQIRPRRVSAATLAHKPVPEREWLVRQLVPGRNVTLLYGDGGVGKSLLALQLAAAVVTGLPFFGHATQRGPVEFVTAEDSLDELHRRLVDVARTAGTTFSELEDLKLTSLAETDALLAVLQDQRGGTLTTTPLYDELCAIVAESRPALLILDTLADIYGGNEIVRAQARQFVAMLRKIALAYNTTIIVLAHPSLSGMDKGTSGSTGWSNSVRSRLFFRRVEEKDGTEPDEDARVLTVGKLNYGRVGLEIPMRWCAGAFVSGPTGGDPLIAQARAERVFIDLLRKFESQGRNVSSATGANYAPKLFEADARVQNVRKRELIDAMGRLLENGRIRNESYGPASRGTRRLAIIESQ